MFYITFVQTFANNIYENTQCLHGLLGSYSYQSVLAAFYLSAVRACRPALREENSDIETKFLKQSSENKVLVTNVSLTPTVFTENNFHLTTNPHKARIRFRA